MSPKEEKRNGRFSNPLSILVIVASLLMVFGALVLHPEISDDSMATPEHEYEGLAYRITSSDEVMVVNDLDILGVVNIPDKITIEGNEYKVTSIGRNVFSYSSGIESITLGAYIREIHDGAFWGCSWLKTIELPQGLETVGADVFKSCKNLTSIDLGNSLTSIGNGMFMDCEALTSITIPGTVGSIGNGAFHNCLGLRTVIFAGEGLTHIGNDAFRNCKALDGLTLPGTLVGDSAFGTYAFYECTSLKTVTLSEGITVIPSYLFAGLESLTSVVLPSSLTRIDDHAFASCSRVKVEMDGLTKTKLTYIGDYAFNGCLDIVNIELPDSMTHLGEGAFYQCAYLVWIRLNTGLLDIGNLALAGTALETVTIPSSVTTFGQGVLSSCKHLKEISVDTGNECIKVVDNVLYSFDGKTLLQVPGAYPRTTTGDAVFEFVVPDTVETIGMRAFAGCTFESIRISNSVTAVGNGAFMSCAHLASVHWSNKTTVMKSTVFKDCVELRTVFINGSEKIEIEAYAFQGGSKVKFVSASTDPNVVMKMYRDEEMTKSLSLDRDMSSYRGTVYFKWDSSTDPVDPDVPTDDDKDTGGDNVAIYIGIVAGIVVILGAVAFLFLRRKQ